MKIILHIGTDKTGSTAIQKHLYVNRQWLLDRGVFIPLTGFGKDNGHGKLLSTMVPVQISALIEELQNAKSEGCATAIISWEGMCFLDARQIRRLVSALSAHDLWLLVYLREQADIVQTGYLQEIKTGKAPVDIADFQQAFWKPAGLRAQLVCYSAMRNYARILKKWRRFLPAGRVIVREFKRELLFNQSVVDDLLSVLGQAPDDNFLRMKNTSNISLDVESAMLINEEDKLGGNEELRKTSVYTLLSLINSEGGGAKYFLPAHRVASIRRYYRRSNQAISRIIGSPLPSLFSDPPNCTQSHTQQDLRERVKRLQIAFSALMEIPMLYPSKPPHNAPDDDLLNTGWCKLQDWGAWSSSEVSSIRFRVPFWMASHDRGRLIIFLKGRYHGNNKSTTVSVNGLELGQINLRSFVRSITIPVTALHKNQMVEIQLHHEFPEYSNDSGKTSANKRIAFGIERIGLQFLNPE